MTPALDWLHLALRWFHFTAGVAWVGASFYFIWLNNTLRPPREPSPGVDGELWAIHGGGYYRVQKYDPRLERLPEPLHWFKWEAYLTWLSGFSLLLLLFYTSAASTMGTPGGPGPNVTMAVGLGAIFGGWFVYDALCRWLEKRPVLLAGLGLVLLSGVVFGLHQVMSARAAYVHVGALLGTIMAGNVFRVIIPVQKAMVEATKRGELADPANGKKGALRSLHNNYLTLPVLFVMLSNHFPMSFGHPWSWAILLALFVVGAGVRHHINRHEQGRTVAWALPAALVAFVGLAFVASPRRDAMGSVESGATWADVQPILQSRCVTCHAAKPTFTGYQAPPKGVVLETEADARAWAARVQVVAVDTQFMPLANLTHMTPDERATLAGWLAGLN